MPTPQGCSVANFYFTIIEPDKRLNKLLNAVHSVGRHTVQRVYQRKNGLKAALSCRREPVFHDRYSRSEIAALSYLVKVFYHPIPIFAPDRVNFRAVKPLRISTGKQRLFFVVVGIHNERVSRVADVNMQTVPAPEASFGSQCRRCRTIRQAPCL